MPAVSMASGWLERGAGWIGLGRQWAGWHRMVAGNAGMNLASAQVSVETGPRVVFSKGGKNGRDMRRRGLRSRHSKSKSSIATHLVSRSQENMATASFNWRVKESHLSSKKSRAISQASRVWQ